LNPTILRQVSLGVSAIPMPRILPQIPRSGFVLEPKLADRMAAALRPNAEIKLRYYLASHRWIARPIRAMMAAQ